MRTLVRNGCVIDTEPEPVARPGVDLLIEDDRIVAVGPDLAAGDARIIDATDRIVLPGLVDTHRHLWQAPLRSVVTDVTLAEYMAVIQRRFAPRYRARDVRIGNLLGALECLDAGITTVQDYSHIQYSHGHTDAALAGLRAAGIRTVFGYGFSVAHADARDPDGARRARELCGGLITMALAPVGPSYRPEAEAVEDWQLAAELDVPIVVHIGSGPVATQPITLLHRHGLLRPDTLYVHGNSLPDGELELIASTGASVAITPAVEARMGHGAPMIGRLRAAGITTGLGVDVVSAVAGDLFSVMRAAWLTSQLTEGPSFTPADLLRMATVDGARALGMADRIGSLRVGKQADVILLRTDDVNLATADRHDPIGAVVTAAHPGNVDTVLVAGRIVKQSGRLVDVDLPAAVAEARKSAEYLAG